MPLIYPLCSSSKGNATFVGNANNGILIDAGLSLRQLVRQLSLREIELSAIRAIFITHEHSDHIKGLFMIAKELQVPIYTARETAEYLISHDQIPPRSIVHEICRKTALINGIQVSAFTTPHDCAHSLGFKVTLENGKTACICTDLGHMTEEVFGNLSGSDFVLLESNYDQEMLENGPYPRFLKQRIFSNNGHLSNDDCADTLMKLFNLGTCKFVLGHLSEHNNSPEIAFKTSLAQLIKTGATLNEDYILTAAKRQSLGEIVEL